MNRFIVSSGCIAAVLLSTSIAVAQGRGNGGPKVKPTAGAAKGGGAAAHGGTKATGPRSTAHAGAKPRTAPTPNAGGKHAAAANTRGPKAKTSTATSETTGTAAKKNRPSPATTDGLSPVQQKLQRNTNLATKLEGRLPAGLNMVDASEGFASLGQFVSTVNAAHNHDLDFAKLKIAILDDGMSLGQAMKDQRASLDGTRLASRAERDADALIKSTEPADGGPTTTKAKPRSPKDNRQ